MENPLKISIIDKTGTKDFEKLCVLLKKFSLETYLGNKPEFANVKGQERYKVLNKAINELDGKENNSILSNEDIENIKKEFEHQVTIAKKFTNSSREDLQTRYYVLKDGDNIVAFQQGQIWKEPERTEGWRNLIYAEPEYRGKAGETLDIQGNLNENSYFDALYEEIEKWFDENEVKYERICTGVNMVHNIQKYINKGFTPFSKNQSNIFLEKYSEKSQEILEENKNGKSGYEDTINDDKSRTLLLKESTNMIKEELKQELELKHKGNTYKTSEDNGEGR